MTRPVAPTDRPAARLYNYCMYLYRECNDLVILSHTVKIVNVSRKLSFLDRRMKQIYTVVAAALLLIVSSSAVAAAQASADESTAFAVEGRPIEAVICHVDDDGSAEYVMVRSKNTLQTHLQEHPKDYRFGTKLGACELGGSTPPGANASGADESGDSPPSATPDLSEVRTARTNASEGTSGDGTDTDTNANVNAPASALP